MIAVLRDLIARLIAILLILLIGELFVYAVEARADVLGYDIAVAACYKNKCAMIGRLHYGGNQYPCETHLDAVIEHVRGQLELPYGLPVPAYEIRAKCVPLVGDQEA